MGIFTKKKQSGLSSRYNKEVHIKQITINSHRDFTVLRHNLLDGNIMICNLKPLVKIAKKDRTNQDLHNSLQKIKHYCIQNGAMVSKLEESLLLITPNSDFMINSV
ncbi:hypothetical protein [Candidatus Lokiarchaeum ossiferum]|uniref:hypothetical protein n=1 Tax=Candidatus Lokiarchaeum ossiferum TaxID=2951803 RepID=UPI00352C4D44